VPTVLAVLLHGATGSWDEIAMLGGSVLIGLALAFVLKPKKRDEP
jgi:hypothetical protein